MVTEHQEHARTQKALDTLATWGKTLPGENIAFSLARQGAPSDAFILSGDCTPFTASGKRGTLHGQPAGDTGAPVAVFFIPTFTQVPCTFAFDLNKGEVTVNGNFAFAPPNLSFTVEYISTFSGGDGTNLLFHSEKTSDDAGYVIVVQLVAA